MNAGSPQETSLRLAKPEISRLAWAFGLSLALHLIGFGGFELGKKFNLWQHLHLPAWLERATAFASVSKPPAIQPPQEAPLMLDRKSVV